MKKAIVHIDLNGLSRNGLDNYAKATLGVPEADYQLLQNVAKHDSMPLMNVADMIEFLDDAIGMDEWVRKLYGIESDLVSKEWIARNPRRLTYKTGTGGTGVPTELCDALWEQVKEVLNNG